MLIPPPPRHLQRIGWPLSIPLDRDGDTGKIPCAERGFLSSPLPCHSCLCRDRGGPPHSLCPWACFPSQPTLCCAGPSGTLPRTKYLSSQGEPSFSSGAPGRDTTTPGAPTLTRDSPPCGGSSFNLSVDSQSIVSVVMLTPEHLASVWGPVDTQTLRHRPRVSTCTLMTVLIHTDQMCVPDGIVPTPRISARMRACIHTRSGLASRGALGGCLWPSGNLGWPGPSGVASVQWDRSGYVRA